MNNLRRLLATTLLIFASGTVFAQQRPPIRWVVPYPAGGGADATARIIADELRTSLGQSIVVDNRPGAATNIGVDQIRSARADGSTIGTADNASLTFNEHLFSKLSYDPKRDFRYIAMMARVPLVLVATTSLPVSGVQELLKHLQSAGRNALSYASVGVGSAHHMGMELFKSKTQVFLTHVAYRGSAQAVPDLISGQVQVMLLELPAAIQLIKANKIKALGVASAQRTDLLPDVPTLSEQGVKEFEIYGFMGLIGPAELPPAEVERLGSALQAALKSPTVVRRFTELGIEPFYMPSEPFYRFCRAESDRWGELIRVAGIQKE